MELSRLFAVGSPRRRQVALDPLLGHKGVLGTYFDADSFAAEALGYEGYGACAAEGIQDYGGFYPAFLLGYQVGGVVVAVAQFGAVDLVGQFPRLAGAGGMPAEGRGDALRGLGIGEFVESRRLRLTQFVALLLNL